MSVEAVNNAMSTALTADKRPTKEPSVDVGVCAEDPQLVDRLCAALADGDLARPRGYSDLASTLEACALHHLEVVVIGARRLDPATLDAVGALTQAFPEVRVVIACERSAAGDIRKALDAGTRGFVLVDEVDDVLAPVLRVVRAGQVSVPGRRGQEAGKRLLTTRERQILGLVVTGMTNAEIASHLYLAESTVKSHLSSSFAKLGVASRNEATALVLDPVRGQGLGLPAPTAPKTA